MTSRMKGPGTSQPSPGKLCNACSKIPFENLFKQRDTNVATSYMLDQLSSDRIQNASCCFCYFLNEIQTNFPFKTHGRKKTFRFVSDGKPWYENAGIALASLPRPTAWLQLASSAEAGMAEPYVCISSVPSDSEYRLDGGHYLPRARQDGSEWVDHRLVRDWLEICDSHHADECNQSFTFKRRFLDMKIIDIRNRSVVLDPGSVPYAALSYVWGGKLSSAADVPELVANQLPDHVPKTVEDAMSFTSQLGLRYLWVDRYCINQADAAEKQSQIDGMDLIYECAYLTIIALDGINIDQGLAGISRPLKYTIQPKVVTAHGTFMATFVHSIWDHQGLASWDRRAWTLQEQALSRRCIYFDTSHVYMKCRKELFHDLMPVDTSQERDLTVQSRSYFWENGWELSVWAPDWTFAAYSTFVANYTRRELSDQHDALNACRGILNQLTRNTGAAFIWGLPQIEIVRALLWEQWEGAQIKRRPCFPSWSWLGWEGRTEYGYWLHDMDAYNEAILSKDMEEHQAKSTDKYMPSAGVLTKHDVIRDSEAFIQIKGMQDWEDLIETKGNKNNKRKRLSYSLRISSTVARFGFRMVCKHGQKSKYPLDRFDKSFKAVGDRWTLVDREGRPIVQEAHEWDDGEKISFQERDYFFSLHRQDSKAFLNRHVVTTGDLEAELLFVAHWPAIKASKKSDSWLYDMVSALVIRRNQDGSAWRVASVLIRRHNWMAAHPTHAVVDLS